MGRDIWRYKKTTMSRLPLNERLWGARVSDPPVKAGAERKKKTAGLFSERRDPGRARSVGDKPLLTDTSTRCRRAQLSFRQSQTLNISRKCAMNLASQMLCLDSSVISGKEKPAAAKTTAGFCICD
jgi:hypothetical protein